MGLTPMEGLVMGTRSGDVDPGLLGYLAERTGQTVGELTEALDTRSGLLGLSGWSNDMRTVQTAAAQGDERAQLALDVFVHRLAKAIAGMFTSLAAGRATWSASCIPRSCTRATCPGGSRTWPCSPRAFRAASAPWTMAG